MINSVTLAGHLGKNPETLTLDTGLVISKFTVAVNDVRGKGDEKRIITHWIECTSFGNLATTISKYLANVAKITLNGRLYQHKWESTDGKKMSKLGVLVENIEFMLHIPVTCDTQFR